LTQTPLQLLADGVAIVMIARMATDVQEISAEELKARVSELRRFL
jgi:hypothetical protein